MKIHWKLVLTEALLTGSIFCIAILAYLRISPALSATDYPIITEQEILALEHYAASPYEQILSTILALAPILWGLFRIISKLENRSDNLGKFAKYLHIYIHLIIWNFVISNMDLIIVDWLVICYLKAPISGIEHLLSDQAITSYQSYAFHFREHYMSIGPYMVLLIAPLIFTMLTAAYIFIKNRLK